MLKITTYKIGWMVVAVLIMCILHVPVASAQIRQSAQAVQNEVVVFEPTAGAYSSTRIPALVLTKKGTLLAFAAGRIESASDWADMDLLLRRSEDGGSTWSPIQVVAERAGNKPTDNPTPIVGDDGTIHLLYQRDYAYAYYTQSTDDGLTWAPPLNITPTFEAFKTDYDWKVLAPGPGHSIQLKSGRLLVPVWLANSDKLAPHRSHRPSRIATIYSDDSGKTWQRGAMVPEVEGFKNPSETMAVQLPDGTVMLSIRNESEKRRKGVSFSKDGISGWTTPAYDEALFEPICMSSILGVDYQGTDYLIFLNPDSEHLPKHPRQNLTLKASEDSGKAWGTERVIYDGISGYSDMAVGPDGTIYCLFEKKESPDDDWSLVLRRTTMDALKE
ncbi:sialidase family protein [Parapedobacter sp. DT-150]|uniref:sialidase family protein n=1 Tax=Parapedobacter sp. DT-150 TaxID=3396162 RepID=UPI003F1C228E